MKRIILHWTAGTHTASALDKKHYHYIIQGDGSIVEGIHKPEANLDTSTPYAAHTRMANTGAIGVAVAAMHGAKERTFSAGKYPITSKQVDALAGLVARLSQKYGIPVQGDLILTHAEVQPNLGIKQRGKWDINWLPGMEYPMDPNVAGENLRTLIRNKLAPPAQPTQTNPLAALIAAIMKLFGKA